MDVRAPGLAANMRRAPRSTGASDAVTRVMRWRGRRRSVMASGGSVRHHGAMAKIKWAALLGAVLLLSAGGVYWTLRGPAGATTALGGSLEAKALPELPAEAARWVNGAPLSLSQARGQVLFVEGWHPA